MNGPLGEGTEDIAYMSGQARSKRTAGSEAQTTITFLHHVVASNTRFERRFGPRWEAMPSARRSKRVRRTESADDQRKR